MLSAKEFKTQMEQNPAVKMLLNEIESWIPDLHLMLEDPSDEVIDGRKYDQFRGSLKALRNVLNAPTVIYEALLEKEEGRDDG